jgi:hypothetical protein
MMVQSKNSLQRPEIGVEVPIEVHAEMRAGMRAEMSGETHVCVLGAFWELMSAALDGENGRVVQRVAVNCEDKWPPSSVLGEFRSNSGILPDRPPRGHGYS